MSLYVNCTHTTVASRYMNKNQRPLFFTPFQRHELRNAIRLGVYRKDYTSLQKEEILDCLQEDCRTGVLKNTVVPWGEVFRESERISKAYTETIGNRGADLFHVAIALVLDSKEFLTFDKKQGELARSTGLSVPFI